MAKYLSLSDFEQILSELSRHMDIDFSAFSPFPLKNIVAANMQKCNAPDAAQYIAKISRDKYFQAALLNDLSFFETEMFRDAAFWSLLHDSVLPALGKRYEKLNFFLPVSNTGEELFSLIILLKDCGIFEKSTLYVSCMNKKNAEDIRNGLADKKKFAVCKKNLDEQKMPIDRSKHFTSKSCHEVLNEKPNSNVHVEISLFNHFPDKDFHLILMRNKLMFLSEKMHRSLIGEVDSRIIPGGFLALGYRENILEKEIEKKYEQVINTEKIFRKIG